MAAPREYFPYQVLPCPRYWEEGEEGEEGRREGHRKRRVMYTGRLEGHKGSREGRRMRRGRVGRRGCVQKTPVARTMAPAQEVGWARQSR